MIEMIVAVGLFSTLMLIIVGSLLSMTDASRKARATRLAIDNVANAIDYMSREIRLGSFFRCEDGNTLTGTITSPRDCPYATGGQFISFERAGGSLLSSGDQMIFRLNTAVPAKQFIEVSTDSGTTYSPLTDTGIQIQTMKFFVDGSNYSVSGSDANQPKISVLIKGLAGNKVKTQVPFTAQTTLTARTPNIPPP